MTCFPHLPSKWGCPPRRGRRRNTELGVQPVLSLSISGQTAVGQGERGSRRNGGGPSPLPRAGGLASVREHMLFGIILEGLSGMLPMMWLPGLARRGGGEPTADSPFSFRCLLPLSRRGWPIGDTLELLHRTVLVQGTTRPFCPANTALSPGLFRPSMGLSQAPDTGSQTLADRQEPLKY